MTFQHPKLFEDEVSGVPLGLLGKQDNTGVWEWSDLII